MWTLLNRKKSQRWEGMSAADRSWLLTRIAVGALVAYLAMAAMLLANSPALASRVAFTAVSFLVLVGSTLWLAQHERASLGAVVLLTGLLGMVTANAVSAGGIQSPGIQAYFLFVVLGGLLLGWRGALGYAIAIVAVSGWLAVQQQAGMLPHVVSYDPIDRWLFVALYAVVALLVVLAAERSHHRLFAKVQIESEARDHALRQLETALAVGGYGRFVYDLSTRRYRPDAEVTALTGLVPSADSTVDLAEWGDRLHPGDRSRVESTLAGIFNGESEQERVSYRYLHPTQGLKYIDASLLLQRDADGTPLGVTGLLLDLTTQQDTIYRLGERLKEMRLLYHAAHVLREEPLDPTVTLTNLLQRMPPAWQFPELAEAHLTLGELELQTPGWTGHGPRLTAAISPAAGGGMLSVEYRDEPVAFDQATFLTEESELLEAVAHLISSWWVAIDERKRFRQIEERIQQAQRLEAVGTFASGIAHDFNNVLAAVMAMADSARESAASQPEDLAEDLEQIIAAGRRGQALVQRIRRLGRREEIAREPVVLEALLTEVIALARPSAPPGVRVTLECEHGMPPAWADASQLHQVMLNLLSNAFHAMRNRGGVVVVRLLSSPSNATSGRVQPDCLITIADSGVGMSAQVAARIFEPFFTTKGEQGTGLGLSMVHGIIRDHDGVIQVSSVPGRGTTFEVRLPSALPTLGTADESRAAVISRASARIAPHRVTRVLIVDDDEVVLHSNRRLLELAGFQCDTCSNPRDAFEQFSTIADEVSIVLSDMQMPNMSGLDLIRRLRTVRPGLPAILCSGADPLSTAAMLQQERIQWLAKPSRADELVRAVELGVSEA